MKILKFCTVLIFWMLFHKGVYVVQKVCFFSLLNKKSKKEYMISK